MLKAVFKDQHGYESDLERARAVGMKKGEEFTVISVDMGRFSTSIKFEEYPNEVFNSVMFDFFKDGEAYDIYKDPQYNRYLPREACAPKKMMGTLKDARQYGSAIIGVVYGHPHFEDGTLINTSKVLNIENGIAETLNSLYKVEFAPGAEFSDD